MTTDDLTTDGPTLTLADLPTPESSARVADPPGFDHVLADGRAWRLPGFIPVRDRVWDELYDQGSIHGEFEMADVLLAVAKLVLHNYDLPAEFVAWLVAGAQVKPLSDAVNWALYGRRDVLRGYSDWVASSLLANGLDPERVPPDRLREVLHQLVATGRAVPAHSFITADLQAARRAELLDKCRQIEESRVEAEQARSRPTGHTEPRSFAGATP